MINLRYKKVSMNCCDAIVRRLKNKFPNVKNMIEGKVINTGDGFCNLSFNIRKTDNGEMEKEIIRTIDEVIIENIIIDYI